MMSSSYIDKIKEMLDMYKKGEYGIAIGGCNICLGQGKRVLCFSFSSEKSERKEFAHQECLDKLLVEENFRLFAVQAEEQTRKTNKKLQAKNN